MPTYRPPIEDGLFLLNDVLQIQKFNNLPGFEDATPDMIAAIAEEAGKIAQDVLQPLNAVGDLEGCTWHADHTVTAPKGFKEAYDLYSQSGWGALPFPEEYGGQGLPLAINVAVQEYIASANMGVQHVSGPDQRCCCCADRTCSEEQKQAYVPKMLSGEWSGTMNLTEPHCGTDLGMMRTKAVAQDDGTFKTLWSKDLDFSR